MSRRESRRSDVVFATRHRVIGLRGLLLIVAVALVMAAPGRLVAEESAKALTAALRPFVENHTLAGAVVLVAASNRVLALGAVGYMDIAAKRPMRTDALFWIASQSKSMTAAALMMLVDEGVDGIITDYPARLAEVLGRQESEVSSQASGEKHLYGAT